MGFCTCCRQPLFTDESRRQTCGGCFRTAALRLDFLLALAALGTRRPTRPATQPLTTPDS